MAMIAFVFAENLGVNVAPTGGLSLWAVKAIAILGIMFVTCINCLGTIAGARAANTFLILKLITIFSIAVIGITLSMTSSSPSLSKPEWFSGDPDPHRQDLSNWATAGEYITAVYGALFCYGGWESVGDVISFVANCGHCADICPHELQIGFVVGEMTDAKRDLPRIMNTSMTLAISSFILMNVALFIVVPSEVVREKSTVAVVSPPLHLEF